jgi:hypothetical protein
MRRGAVAGVVAGAGSALPAWGAEVALSFGDAPGGTASGFRIERRESGSHHFVPIALVGPGVSEYVDRGLPKDSAYCYRVRARGSVDPKAWSPEVCATAEEPGGTPPPTESTPPPGSEPSALAPAAPAPGAAETSPPISPETPGPAAPGGSRIRTSGGWLQVLD